MPTKKKSPKKKAVKRVVKKVISKKNYDPNHILEPEPFKVKEMPMLPIMGRTDTLEDAYQMMLEQNRLLNQQIVVTICATFWVMALTLTLSKISRRLSYL